MEDCLHQKEVTLGVRRTEELNVDRPDLLTRRAFVNFSGMFFGAFVFGMAEMPFAPADPDEHSPDLRKIILEQYAAYEERNLEKLLDFYTEDCVFDDHTFQIHLKNRSELAELFGRISPQFLAIRFEPITIITSANHAVSLHTQTATIKSQKSAQSEPKKYSVYGISLMEFAGRKIKRQTDFYDALGYQEQIR